MADYPPEAVTAAIDAVMRQRRLTSEGSREWATPIVTAALDAAAPVLAAEIARKILKHADENEPDVVKFPDQYRTWHRLFGTAARITAWTFDVREDRLPVAPGSAERPEVPSRARTAANQAARIVRCPSCGAPAGERCRTVTRYKPGSPGYALSNSHAARKRAARAARAGTEVHG